MASKRARKSGASSKSKTKKAAASHAAPARALHDVIRDLIQARQRGDYRASESAMAALKSFARSRAPAHVQQAAAEAQAVETA